MADATNPSTPEPAVSLHQSIKAMLQSRILSGEWPPGHRIPIEHELMKTYACSRMTVSKVLTELASRGLVERRRRAGTFVAKPRLQFALLQIPDVKAEIIGLGAAYALKILARATRRSTAADRHRLSISQPGPVLAMRYLHFADARPFALEDRLIDLTTVPQARDESFAVEPPGSWLLAHVPWSAAEHSIGAINADPETASLLGVAPNGACLVLSRRTWRGAAPVTAADTVFPAGGYRLVARFEPGGGRADREAAPKNQA